MRVHSSQSKRATTTIGAVLVAGLAVFSLDAMTHAATGDSLILGQFNVANNQTTLKNTGTGTTLSLISADPSRPNLKLSSAARVANLNADLLDGLDSTAFLPVNGKASDSDRLDGLDSTAFVRGPGRMERGARALAPDGTASFVVMSTSAQPVTIAYNCPSSLAANGIIVFRNDSSETVNVFSDNGGSNPSYQQLPPGERWDQGAAAGGERITFQVQGSGVATIEVFSVHRASDCHIQAEAWSSAG